MKGIDDTILLDDIYIYWIERKSRMVKHSTLNCYRMIYESYLRNEFGKLPANELDRSRIEPVIWDYLERLAVKTCRDILAVLKDMLCYTSQELGLDVPDFRWRMPWPSRNRGKGNRVERYSRSEVAKIRDYCIDHLSGKTVGIMLALFGGLRIGEVCALRWQDVDFRHRVVRVDKTAVNIYDVESRKCVRYISEPKTLTSTRTVPVAGFLVPLLRKLARGRSPDSYIVSGCDTPPWIKSYREFYMRLVKSGPVGLERSLTFHALRHTFASLMIEGGADPKTLSAILGHSNVTTTMNLYVHPSDETKETALNRALKKLSI